MIQSKEGLQKLYESVYAGAKEDFFSRFVNGRDISETDKLVLSATKWAGKRVVDIGCGTGETAAGIAGLGATFVTGIDYSPSAIEKAEARHSADNLHFEVTSLDDYSEPVDVVVSCGTLEHMEMPELELKKMVGLVKGKGEIVLTCPYFLNLRGFIWMSLALLLDVPMSLTDRHYISPFDIERWLKGTDMRLVCVQPFDYERANGQQMLVDMKKRLTNALCDAGLPNKGVDTTLVWLEKVVEYEARTSPGRFGGANALYLIQPVGATQA
jgi:2-polyprenyl-3-methyl-5-hydroxy-6-metoxy-1,4-benzoquinol methylase